MNGESSQTEPKKRSRRFYIILSAAVLLLIIIGVVCVDYLNRTNYGPGPIEIEVTTDKPFYLQGEEIRFSININNQQDWPVPYPTTVLHHIVELNYHDYAHPPPPSGASSIPAHHKTFYYVYVWDQKVGEGNNQTQVQPGNYTFTVSFEGSVDYGDGANCTIEIRQKS